MYSYIPIVSQRLYSKDISQVNVGEVFALFSSQQLLAFTDVPIINSTSEIKELVTYYTSHDRVSAFLYAKDANTCIGFVSVSLVLKHKTASLTVVILPQFQNMKYMQEVLPLVIEYLLTHCNIFRIEAQVYVNNIASIKALENVGFKREGLLRKNFMIQGNLEDSWMLSYLKSDLCK